MRERERTTIGGGVLLLLVLWLGFLVHRSPRFAGSLAGSLIGIAGSVLMLIPLAYVVIKRIPALKKRVTRRVSMRTLLAWHIYAGILGPILVVLHSGHKFESALGITLTTLTIIVVVSGFIGRYLMAQLGKEIREKNSMLAALTAAYDEERQRLSRRNAESEVRPYISVARRLGALFFIPETDFASASPTLPQAVRMADAIADVEHAIRSHEVFKVAFSLWLKTHIVLSIGLYVLLGLHVLAGVYFGLRWM